MLGSEAGISRFVVAPDLHPDTDCVMEATRWRDEVAKKFPRARVSLAIWETESWLLADPNAIKAALGFEMRLTPPEKVGGAKPSEVLEEACRKHRGYRRGPAFDKERDGVRIVEKMDLALAAAHSPSLRRLLSLIK